MTLLVFSGPAPDRTAVERPKKLGVVNGGVEITFNYKCRIRADGNPSLEQAYITPPFPPPHSSELKRSNGSYSVLITRL